MSTYKLNYTGDEINAKISRTITGTSNQITVANGDGISGNPTLSLPSTVYLGSSAKWGRDADNLIDLSSDNNFVVRCSAVNYNLTTSLPYLDGINQELHTTSSPTFKQLSLVGMNANGLVLSSNADTNCAIGFQENGSPKWAAFNDYTNDYFKFYSNAFSKTIMILTEQTINLPQLTASKMLTLDVSKNIVSTYDCNQSVSTTSSPTFAGYTITGGVNFSGAITNLTIVNGQITAAS